MKKTVCLIMILWSFLFTSCKYSNKNSTSVEQADIRQENYYAENCDRELPGKQSCSFCSLNLVKISLPDTLISKHINSDLLEKATIGDIDTILALIEQIPESGFLEAVYEMTPVTNRSYILAIQVYLSRYAGGAHGSHQYSFYNYNLKTGEEILLDGFLLPGFEEKLNRIGEKLFLNKYANDIWDFKTGEFELNHNFAITEQGLFFKFNEYEIGPYSNGRPEVLIPYKKFQDLIQPESILSDFWK